ncbi:MAG: hypothetical protein KME29_20490 [Calothrix sp. FI2-JRJ7]|jgi:hypothetical protein|nr:hypothetical protein [Calothrix sp. FI2-JRJ7]
MLTLNFKQEDYFSMVTIIDSQSGLSEIGADRFAREKAAFAFLDGALLHKITKVHGEYWKF